MANFVETPLDYSWFNPQGIVPDGSSGSYDGTGCPAFEPYKRTSSGNAVKEKFYEKAVPSPSGEPDQY